MPPTSSVDNVTHSQDCCAGCGGSLAPWATKNDRSIHRCVRCGLIWVPAGIALEDMASSIYEGDNPIFLQDGNINYYLDPSHLLNFSDKLKWVEALSPAPGQLLDAGANFGHFLSLAGKSYDAVGFDVSDYAVRWSQEHFGVRSQVASIHNLPADLAGPFDVITCFDVIEHVPDPFGALASLNAALKPGGHLFLTTPDAGSLAARLLGRRWHYLDPVQHIVLFSRPTLIRALRDLGLVVEDVHAVGHVYNMGYILDRLAHLHADSILGKALSWVARNAPGPLRNRTIRINLGDVMGIAARKPS